MIKEDQRRAFLAVAISMGVLVGWNHFFGPKESKTSQEVVKTQQVSEDLSVEPVQKETQSTENTIKIDNIQLKEHSLSYNDIRFLFNNEAVVFDAQVPQTTSSLKFIAGSEEPIEFFVRNNDQFEKMRFEFNPPASNTVLEGMDAKNNVKLRLEVNESGRLRVRFDTPNPRRFRVVFNSKEFDADKELSEEESSGGASFLGASADQKYLRKYLLLLNDLEEVVVGSDGEGEAKTKWFGTDSNYHLFAFVLNEKRSVKYTVKEDGPMIVDFNSDYTTFEGDIVFAKKIYDELKAMGDNLHMSIDFGIFSIVAVPLFKGLKLIHGALPNWGIAIILLTLLIRLGTFPLYMKQMKSMNKMKKIQPQLQKLKDKFKDDPRRQQQETMELFKRNGVNPVGGCLPLILQMPIFIAFYKTLTVSAELDNQPFFGWIINLTAKDPYYILPALVALVMFINQKLMPQASADPTQQKVMQFMPLIFAFIFINMPAGLNIYILVSTLFGILQQVYVNKTMA